MINNVPPYGIKAGQNGQEKMILIASGKHNQYSTEGFIAGILTITSSMLFVQGLRAMHDSRYTLKYTIILFTSGFAVVLLIHKLYRMK